MAEVIAYVCNECRFRFRRKETWGERVCPNCGREGTFERAEDTLNKFIREVE